MIAMMNKQYGLDKPLWQQYLKYLGDILHGNFGVSYQSINQKVSKLILQRLGVSVHLGFQALVVGISDGLLVDCGFCPPIKTIKLMASKCYFNAWNLSASLYHRSALARLSWF